MYFQVIINHQLSFPDYIVQNSTVRYKIIFMFLGDMVISLFVLVGMPSITLLLGVLCQQLLKSKKYWAFCTYPLFLGPTSLIQKT